MKAKRCLLIMTVAIMLLVPSCKMIGNHSPIITSLKAEPETLHPLGSCQIECIASDEDGDELSYEWLASKGHVDGDAPTVTWTSPESEGIYNIMVRVSDGKGGEVTDSVTIIVRINNPPTIGSLIGDVDWVTALSSCQVECDAGDPDGDKLSYQWSTDGGDVSGTGPVVTWTAPDGEGLYNIMVVVTDGYGGEDARSLAITVAPEQPPVIEDLIVTPQEPRYLKEYPGYYKAGKAKKYDIECIVSDTSGELVYEWSCNDGEISGEGSMITWTAPGRAVQVTVTVTVSNAAGDMVSNSIVLKVVSCSPCTFR